VSQFQREFQHRSQRWRLLWIGWRRASGRGMAFRDCAVGRCLAYLTEAQSMAQDAQLDFLEIVGRTETW
jgi:hypothetical protein